MFLGGSLRSIFSSNLSLHSKNSSNTFLNMFSFKLVIFSVAFLAIVSAQIGVPEALVGEKLELATKRLKISLEKTKSNLELVKVITAAELTVSGTTYMFNTLLKGPWGEKKCEVGIWYRPWIKRIGVRLTIECQGVPRFQKQHSPTYYE